MPATKKRTYARYTLTATKLLGQLVELARKERRMPAQELADRIGVTRGTLQRLEGGDPKVELGLAFEACAILGIKLFDDDLPGMTGRLDDTRQRLALLPKYARPPRVEQSDDF